MKLKELVGIPRAGQKRDSCINTAQKSSPKLLFFIILHHFAIGDSIVIKLICWPRSQPVRSIDIGPSQPPHIEFDDGFVTGEAPRFL